MPVDPQAPEQVTAYNWVPPFARGLVRDLRVRWALEEAGIPYSVRLLDARAERPADYLLEQPFGQVPSYRDGEVQLFESGAIVLHIGERSEALLPRDPAGRARATTWVFTALNTLEPSIQQLAALDAFPEHARWACAPRDAVVEAVRRRLGQLATHLAERDWFEGRFTVGDLMIASVLRMLKGKGLIEAHPNLAAHVARCEARPAFQRALAAQMADFEPTPA